MDCKDLLDRIKILEEENENLKQKIVFLEKKTLKQGDYESIRYIVKLIRPNL